MVSTSAPPTTIRLFRKYRPMLAAVQARAQLSKCGVDGNDHGEFRISSSDLTELTTAHNSGSAVTTAQQNMAICGSGFFRFFLLGTGGAARTGAGRERRRVMP